MLISFAQYLLRGRLQAIFMVLLFSVLPYFNWVACVIVAFIAWRKGAGEGFIVMLWALLPVVVTWWVGGHFSVLPLIVSCYNLMMVWLAALALRRWPNWSWVVQGLALVGIVVVLLAHVLLPDITGWWQKEALAYVTRLQSALGAYTQSSEAVQEISTLSGLPMMLAPVMTGLGMLWLSISVLISLFLARLLNQAAGPNLFLAREQSTIRLHWGVSVALILVMIVSHFLWHGLADVLPILWMPFIVAGLTILHGFVISRRIARWLMLLIYLILWTIAIIWWPFIFLFGFIGLLDSLIHFRKKR